MPIGRDGRERGVGPNIKIAGIIAPNPQGAVLPPGFDHSDFLYGAAIGIDVGARLTTASYSGHRIRLDLVGAGQRVTGAGAPGPMARIDSDRPPHP
jgi:hypothetical protein